MRHNLRQSPFQQVAEEGRSGVVCVLVCVRVRVSVSMCWCVCKRERERERVWVYECLWERKRERESVCVCVCVCMCVCVWMRERDYFILPKDFSSFSRARKKKLFQPPGGFSNFYLSTRHFLWFSCLAQRRLFLLHFLGPINVVKPVIFRGNFIFLTVPGKT